jgi:CheY-like chemotaxis protein
MLLITFVENIFKHGIDRSAAGNAFGLSLVQQDGFLLFSTENPLPADGPKTSSQGSGSKTWKNVLSCYTETGLNYGLPDGVRLSGLSKNSAHMNLRCLIVDDEPNAVKLLEMFILQNTSWDQPAKCYDAREALTYLKTYPVDLIFLDINMPHLTGMEMATLLPPSVRIVFTTAYSEYAADSYGYPTIDYLLKPITLKRFYAALQKIEAHYSRADQSGGISASPVMLPSPVPSAAPPFPQTPYRRRPPQPHRPLPIPLSPNARPPSLRRKNTSSSNPAGHFRRSCSKRSSISKARKNTSASSPRPTNCSSTGGSRISKNSSPPLSPGYTIPISSISPSWSRSAIIISSSAESRYPSARNSARRL